MKARSYGAKRPREELERKESQNGREKKESKEEVIDLELENLRQQVGILEVMEKKEKAARKKRLDEIGEICAVKQRVFDMPRLKALAYSVLPEPETKKVWTQPRRQLCAALGHGFRTRAVAIPYKEIDSAGSKIVPPWAWDPVTSSVINDAFMAPAFPLSSSSLPTRSYSKNGMRKLVALSTDPLIRAPITGKWKKNVALDERIQDWKTYISGFTAEELRDAEVEELVVKAKAIEFYQKQKDKFNELIQKILSLDINNTWARFKSAERFATERPKEVLVYLNSLLKLEPTNIPAWLLRAQVFISLGKKEEALHDVGVVLTSDPNNIRALELRSLILFLLGRKEELLETYSTLLQLQPGVFNVSNFEKFSGTMFAVDDVKKKLEVLNSVLKILPHYEDALKTRAELLNLMGRYEEALNDWKTLYLLPTETLEA